MYKDIKAYYHFTFAASRLFELAEQRRIGCDRGQSNVVNRETTAHVETKVLWHVNMYIRIQQCQLF